MKVRTVITLLVAATLSVTVALMVYEPAANVPRLYVNDVLLEFVVKASTEFV